MQYREIGHSGIQASRVAFGCWAIGGTFWGGSDEKQSIGAIQHALDTGTNLLDTAPFYGRGFSEELVGRAIQGRRDKAVLATKCGLNWKEPSDDFFFSDGECNIYRNLSPDAITRELEDSLQRLQTDHIDLYQTHWQTSTTPIADTMAALLKMKEQGKIRAIGVSNAGPEIMDQYRQVGILDSNQPGYNLLHRDAERDVLPYCRRHGISTLVYSPLAQGLLTGKVTPNRQFPPGDVRLANPWVRDKAALKRLLRVLESVFAPIAQSHDATLAQLVIAWTLAQPGVTSAICGARSTQQVDENAKGADIDLSSAEIDAMRKAIDTLEPPAA